MRAWRKWLMLLTLMGGCWVAALAAILKPGEVVRQAFGAAQAGKYQQADTALSGDDRQRTKAGRRELWDRFVRNGDFQKIEILRETVRGEGAEVRFRAYYNTEFWAPTSWGPARPGKALEGNLKLQLEQGHWKLLGPDPDSWTIWYPDTQS